LGSLPKGKEKSFKKEKMLSTHVSDAFLQGPYSDQTNSFSTRSGNTSMLEQNILKFFGGGSIRAQDEDKCILPTTIIILPPKKHSK